MCYSKYWSSIINEYITSENIGKKIVVEGETAFPKTSSKAVMLKLDSITFVDHMISSEELRKKRDNMPDFSTD
jgi:hypothetical protein